MRRASSTGGIGPIEAVGRLVDLALIAVVAVGLSSVVIGRVLPMLGHPVYVVAGPSMEPAIRVGSAVILDRVAGADLAVGDVVSLRSGAGRAIFTHRIIRLAERDGTLWLETKGDANEASDPSITPASAVIGRVGVSVPYAGYLIALLSTVPGVVLVLSTGALLLALGWWLDGITAERRRTAPTPAEGAAPPSPADPIATPRPRRRPRPSGAAARPSRARAPAHGAGR